MTHTPEIQRLIAAAEAVLIGWNASTPMMPILAELEAALSAAKAAPAPVVVLPPIIREPLKIRERFPDGTEIVSGGGRFCDFDKMLAALRAAGVAWREGSEQVGGGA